MQSDGNFVVYMRGGGALWATGTNGSGANKMVVQSDGNAVLYAPSGAKWSTGTAGQGAGTLTMRDDGNLVLATGARPEAWTSKTCCR